jgi:tRNA(Ile2) C34 agmatinyltransferase TiaS
VESVYSAVRTESLYKTGTLRTFTLNRSILKWKYLANIPNILAPIIVTLISHTPFSVEVYIEIFNSFNKEDVPSAKSNMGLDLSMITTESNILNFM